MSTTFAPIDLTELNEHAALQTRVDRKYLVSADLVDSLPDWLDPQTRVLTIAGHSGQAYRSVYFDTPDLHAYHLAARRRRRRYKVRTRAYRETGTSFLEVKTRAARGLTHKVRIPHETEELDALDAAAPAYIATVLADTGSEVWPAWQLRPTLSTAYRRTTLLIPGSDGATRITIDTHLRWQLLTGRSRAELYRPDLAIIETKSGSGAAPTDQLLWRRGIRPIAFSKYATGLAALSPDLPANRWSRILRTAMTPSSTN